MNETRTRLTKCFLAVFPDLPAGEVEMATPSSVKGWDSVASLTLLTVVGEEFGVDIDFADLLETLSYERIAAYLQEKIAADSR